MTTLEELMGAVRGGDVSRVTGLLRDDPRLAMERPAGGPSALLMAAYMRNQAVVGALRSVVRCDAAEAAALGDDAALRTILDARPADISSRSGDGWTPLHLAAYFGHESTVLLLLERGADVRALSLNGEANTALHAGLAGAGSVAIAEALLDAGADPRAVGGGGYRPLHIAAGNGKRELVELLLARGADPNDRAANGQTAATMARERNFEELAVQLSRLEGARVSR